MKKTLLIDTNTLLHYRRLNEVDWLKETSAPEVDILVPPVVIRELEKHKDLHSVKRIRKRAAEYVKWFSSLLSDGLSTELRPGVTLRFLSVEPSLDFALHQLNKDLADDWLIARAIEQSQNRPDSSQNNLETHGSSLCRSVTE